MQIEKVMETPDKYYGAYSYYKKHLDQGEMTREAELAKAARMFMIPNIESFIKFANEMEASNSSI